VVGDDYVWPRASARAVRRFVGSSPDVRILGEVFVPLGTEDFSAAVRRVVVSGAQGILMFLVGSDAVQFNRAFAAAGLDRRCVRLSPLMEENMLMATGAENTHELYAASGFFETLPTSSGLEFSRRYTERFGVRAPALNSMGESCFEGLTLLARLAARAGSLELDRLCGAACFQPRRRTNWRTTAHAAACACRATTCCRTSTWPALGPRVRRDHPDRQPRALNRAAEQCRRP
jgi:urea transport system substrate-binding protein